MSDRTDVDRWKAVRKGPRYCAPACGGGCTFAAFRFATQEATKMAKELGPGWTPRVWENLGWCFSADRGVASIHLTQVAPLRDPPPKSLPRRATCFMNLPKQIVTTAATPKLALKKAVETAEALLQETEEKLAEFRPMPVVWKKGKKP